VVVGAAGLTGFGWVISTPSASASPQRGGELAGYILATAQAGTDFPNLDGLVLATAIGAIGLGAIVGVMSSVIPYSLQLISLRRLPPETFAILTCLSPVVAAIAGWLILGQHLAVTGYVAIVLVTMASIGAVRAARDRLAQKDTGLITA
jgi:inner membrane transporter RhtA